MEQERFWDDKASSWKQHDEFGDANDALTHFAQEQLQIIVPYLPALTRVVDLGSGANNEAYYETIIPREIVWSMDISPKMLQLNASAYKINGDVSAQLPIKSNSVDLCTSFFAMRYISFDSQVQLLSEIHRILKPGGWFLLIDLPKNPYPNQLSRFEPNALLGAMDTDGYEALTPITQKLTMESHYSSGFGLIDTSRKFRIGALYGQKVAPIEGGEHIWQT